MKHPINLSKLVDSPGFEYCCNISYDSVLKKIHYKGLVNPLGST